MVVVPHQLSLHCDQVLLRWPADVAPKLRTAAATVARQRTVTSTGCTVGNTQHCNPVQLGLAVAGYTETDHLLSPVVQHVGPGAGVYQTLAPRTYSSELPVTP